MSYKPSHISFSQIMTYVDCPEHYLFRYVLGIKSPPKRVMTRGRTVHRALEQHFLKKREDGVGLALDGIRAAYEENLESAVAEYEAEQEQTKMLVTKEYLAKEAEFRKSDMLDQPLRGLAAYKKEVDPKIQPNFIEQEFLLETNQGIAIKGYIDLTDKNGIVHETKTSAKRQNIQEIERDPQLGIYQIGYQKLAGKKPKKFVKDFIVIPESKEPFIESYEIKKPDIDPESMLRYIWNVIKAIQNDVWYCIHRANDWTCSTNWCGYLKLHQELREVGFEKLLEKYGSNNSNGEGRAETKAQEKVETAIQK